MEEVINSFFCLAMYVHTVENIKSMYFSFLVQFLLLHDEQLLLLQAHLVQSPVLQVPMEFVCHGDSIIEV